MSISPIYLDYAATTPVHPDVAQAMMECLTMSGNFGNAASRSHIYGWKAEEAVESARQQIAKLIGADTREIVWTSGATESNNLALKGAVDAALESKKVQQAHIVVSSIEHKSVLDTAAQLEKSGVAVSYVKPNCDGVVEIGNIAAALQNNTVLVSVMHANNEVGVINEISKIGALCRQKGVIFHSDAAQTCGKLPLDVAQLNVDLMSLSAHKMYGPKGIGVLYVRRHPDVKISAQMHGGGHERGMRSGTLATHQAVGMGKAAEIAIEGLDSSHAKKMRDRFWQGLEAISAIQVNGSMAQRLPGNLNLSFADIDGETLLMSLSDLAISSGSACMSATIAPSYVLTEMGCSEAQAQSSLRFSFGRFTTVEDVDRAIEKVKTAVATLSRASA